MKKTSVFSEHKGPVFGIDLGTTNSCIAILKSGSMSEIISMRDGSVTLPSCVMYNGEGKKPIVGKEAYNKRHLPNVVYSAKTLMGSGKTIKVVNGSWSKEVTPTEVASEVLKALVEEISDRYKEVKDVVITVPADFNSIQVDETIKAAEMAGLSVIQILREPTAASLAIKLEDKIQGDYLVYDLGGGTFDASLISINSNEGSSEVDDFYGFNLDDEHKSNDKGKTYVVKATRGDSHLGGDDIDEELLNIVLNRASTEGFPIKYMSKRYRESLLLRIEKLKKMGINDYSMVLDFKYKEPRSKKEKRYTGEVSLKKDDFVAATEKIFKKTKRYIDELLLDYNGKLNAIVTVGGSTKNPIIQYLLNKEFGIHVYSDLNPDEAVALGAAIQAKNLKYGLENMSILDVISNGIGILSDSKISNIIPRDTTVPCSFNRLFATTVDDQERVTIEIYSGNSVLKERCDYIGSLVVEDLPKGEAGTVGVIVVLNIDSNGSLTCAVNVNGKVKSAEIKNVLGANVNEERPRNLNLKDKKILRWRNYAANLEPNRASELLALVDEFELHGTKEKEIIELLRSTKDDILDISSSSYRSRNENKVSYNGGVGVLSATGEIVEDSQPDPVNPDGVDIGSLL